MKALVKHAPGDGNVDILDVQEPSCGENQIKVEVAYCGVFGTDIHVLHDTFRNYPPVILGHEFAGTVVEVGRQVRDVHLRDKIAGLGATAVTCGRCQYCLSGHFIFCANRRGMGHGVDGGFARFVVMRPDQLYRVPEGLPLEEAALSEPFAAAIQAVTEVSKVRIGDTALISGPGPMGLLCLKLLVAEGIRTIVAGARGDGARLDAARRFGAAAVVNVGEQNLLDVVRENTDGLDPKSQLRAVPFPSKVHGVQVSVGSRIASRLTASRIHTPHGSGRPPATSPRTVRARHWDVGRHPPLIIASRILSALRQAASR